MTLSEIIRTIARGSHILVATLLVALVAAGAYALAAPTTYQASALIHVEPRLPDDATKPALQQAAAYANYQTITFKRLATTDAILDPVIDDLGLAVTSRELARAVTALSALDTAIIELIVEWPDRTEAAQIANGIADEMARVLSVERRDTDVLIDVQVVQRAAEPTAMHTPNIPLVIGFGILAAFFLGLAIIFVREWVSPRVYGPAELERFASAPLLGIVTKKNEAEDVRRIALVFQEATAIRADIVLSVGDGKGRRIAMELAEHVGIPATVADPARRDIDEQVLAANHAIVVATQSRTTTAELATAADTLALAGTEVVGWVLADVSTNGVDAFARRR
ncbi:MULTISPECIES: YveK family protein [unclassified Salinibacterium]|uniref:YveK family protein n=1 Tax=unclassified Salinibacterium TaxID=2632331 RepID=UPI00143D0FF9|nr:MULTISPECIES: Wzz/FepE/Etk N-terminal domain-containing protein [unclassified Salinibacterium]